MTDIPALAVITQKLVKRPAWAWGMPCPVAPDVYEAGEIEMRDNLKKRGFPMCANAELSRDGVRHFLLFGCPIVMDAHG